MGQMTTEGIFSSGTEIYSEKPNGDCRAETQTEIKNCTERLTVGDARGRKTHRGDGRSAEGVRPAAGREEGRAGLPEGQGQKTQKRTESADDDPLS